MIAVLMDTQSGFWGDGLTVLLWVFVVAVSITIFGAFMLLLTMLFGRKGTRHAMLKSFAVSLLVHISLGFSAATWVVWHHVYPPPVLGADRDLPPPIRLQEILIDENQSDANDETIESPVWEKLPDPEDTQIARVDRTHNDWDTFEDPERLPETEAVAQEDVPDLPNLPDEPVESPSPERAEQAAANQEANLPLNVDEKTSEARPEADVNSTSRTRTQVARSGQSDTSVDRDANRGDVDYVEQDVDPENQLASIPGADDPTAYLKRGPEADDPKQRRGPTPSNLPEAEAGRDAKTKTDGGKAGSGGSRRRSERDIRTRRSGDLTALAPSRRNSTPATGSTTPGQEIAVRDNQPVDFSKTGPRPNVELPEFDAERMRERASIPATYRLRSLEGRKETARKYGGSESSEGAVEESLRWLALHQHEQGYWNAAAHGAGNVRVGDDGADERGVKLTKGIPGTGADSGVTALAILAFLGAGYTHEEGQYSGEVNQALQWLVGSQRSDGYLGGQATYYARMYCHAMATYAIAEAYGMQSDPTEETGLREPLRRAVAYIIANQNRDGGWRYLKGQKSDMSIFGWQLMAIKSSEIAGLEISAAAKAKMVRFLKNRSLGKHGGLATYRLTSKRMSPTGAMTAEALFCKQMLGIGRENPQCREGAEFLLEHLPRRSKTNLYYWYYGTLSMYQYGGKPWRQWNESLRDLLVTTQITTGKNAGSWNPTGKWGPYGGRVYSTALSTLCLEVYYRFLPLYQMGGRYDGS